MLISVIIPAYNADKYIANAVYSALEQEDIPEGELEVLVINDCSPDDIDTAMRPFADDPAVRYIKNEKNMGVAETRNRGIRMARGRYVAFLDADDWVDLSMYQKIYDIAERYDIEILQYPMIKYYNGVTR